MGVCERCTLLPKRNFKIIFPLEFCTHRAIHTDLFSQKHKYLGMRGDEVIIVSYNPYKLTN